MKMKFEDLSGDLSVVYDKIKGRGESQQQQAAPSASQFAMSRETLIALAIKRMAG